MECLKVKAFCCGYSLKTGTLVIIIINLGTSFFGLIAWVSTGVITLVLINKDYVEHEIEWIFRLHIGVGMLVNIIQLAMGVILYQGLRTEEPKYMLCYLVMGVTSILVNIATATLTGIFYASAALIWVIEIPHQAYFLLVIRSVYGEMASEMTQDRTNHSISPTAPELENISMNN